MFNSSTGNAIVGTYYRNDKGGIIRNKLENWQINEVFDDDTSAGDLSVRGTDSVIQLNLLDDKLSVLNTYKLYGAYIQNLGAVGYDITGTGAPLSFEATLAYHYWRHE